MTVDPTTTAQVTVACTGMSCGSADHTATAAVTVPMYVPGLVRPIADPSTVPSQHWPLYVDWLPANAGGAANAPAASSAATTSLRMDPPLGWS